MKNSPNQRRANTHLSRRSSPTLLKEIFTSSSAHEHLTTATPPLPPPPPPPARLRPPFLWYPIGWQMIPKKIHHRKRFKDIRTHSARKWQHSWELGTKREARRGGGGGGGVLEGGIKKIKKSRERGRNPTQEVEDFLSREEQTGRRKPANIFRAVLFVFVAAGRSPSTPGQVCCTLLHSQTGSQSGKHSDFNLFLKTVAHTWTFYRRGQIQVNRHRIWRGFLELQSWYTCIK